MLANQRFGIDTQRIERLYDYKRDMATSRRDHDAETLARLRASLDDNDPAGDSDLGGERAPLDGIA